MQKKSWPNWVAIFCLLALPIVALGTVPQMVKTFDTACNTYIYVNEDGKTALVIDPGSKSEDLEKYVKEKGLTIVGILNTHGHGDHIGANGYYARLFKTKVYAYPGDEAAYVNRDKKNKPTNWLNPNEELLSLGNIKIIVLPTPGHSQSSVGFLIGGFLFSGDTLFHESIGRTWGENADELTLQELDGIRNMFFTLPGETLVFPGHGSQTTIQHEKENNPFLN